MKLVTIQSEAAYSDLRKTGVLRCKPELSDWIMDQWFGSSDKPHYVRDSYGWLIEQMKVQIGAPPKGVTYPIWAWYRHHRDRYPLEAGFRSPFLQNWGVGIYYALTIEIPDEQVLLSDHETWSWVLNNWFISFSEDEADWFDASSQLLAAKSPRLAAIERQELTEKSWQRIFQTDFFENDWLGPLGCCVQATFWELRAEQVLAVHRFASKGDSDAVPLHTNTSVKGRRKFANRYESRRELRQTLKQARGGCTAFADNF